MDKEDVFLGSVVITPAFDAPENTQTWFPLQGVSQGEIGLQIDYAPFRVVGI